MQNQIGISQGAAKQAVFETAQSRMALGIITMSIPAMMILPLGRVRMIKSAIRAFPKLQFAKESACIIFALQVGLPLACSIFDTTCSSTGSDLEPKYHAYDKVYFNKGL